jgi:hypothetical protein
VLVKPILEISSVSVCMGGSYKEIMNLLMIDGPNAVVSDQQTVTAQVRRSGSIEVAVSRSCSTDNARSSRLRREPHNSTLPIVTMSQASRWRVLWHVPCVHDGEPAVVRAAASVDLAGAAAASIRRATRGVETGAERGCQLGSQL